MILAFCMTMMLAVGLLTVAATTAIFCCFGPYEVHLERAALSLSLALLFGGLCGWAVACCNELNPPKAAKSIATEAESK